MSPGPTPHVAWRTRGCKRWLRLETAYSMPFNDSRALPPPRIGGVPPGSTQPGTIFNVGLIKTGTGSLDMALSWSGIKTPCKFVPQPIYLDELESSCETPQTQRVAIIAPSAAAARCLTRRGGLSRRRCCALFQRRNSCSHGGQAGASAGCRA